MLGNPRRIASFLLASLIGSIAAGAAARAEPAAAAAAASTDCLAKPNAATAPGNHWYYRVDRASGRHCWYQRAEIAASNDAAQPRAPARAAVSRPADTPQPEPLADMRSEAGDQDAAPPAAASTIPPAQPYSWSTATPPAAPEPMTAPASDNATPTPVTPPQSDAVVAPPRAEPAPSPPIHAQVPQRPATVVEDGGHMPVILGAALALLIVVVGSIVVRLGATLIRSRRRRSARRTPTPTEPPPLRRALDAPALVPPMPHEGDITRAPPPPPPPPPRAPRRPPAARQDEPNAGDATAGRNRDRTRELEQNVRELLHRLRSDLKMEPPASAATETPQPPQQLDEVPAMLRARRNRTAR